jgi:hypothetical protein
MTLRAKKTWYLKDEYPPASNQVIVTPATSARPEWRGMSPRYMLTPMTDRQAEALAVADPRVPAKDAAALLGVSVRTLDRYQAGGLITPTPTPRAPRMFRVADIATLRGASA